MKKTYAQARIKGAVTGAEIEACGSDGVVYLDRRQSLHNQKETATSHFRRLNDSLGKRFVGFTIYRNGQAIVGQALHG